LRCGVAPSAHRGGRHPPHMVRFKSLSFATVLGDRVEVASISCVFEPCSARVEVSSGRTSRPHATGATGAVDFMIAVLNLCDDCVKPEGRLRQPALGLDFDLGARAARRFPGMAPVASHSFAFGRMHAVPAAHAPVTGLRSVAV